MKCPYCKLDNDRVVDTRAVDEGHSIRRRRECLACKRRFSSIENVEEILVNVIKKDGSRELFDPTKVKRSVEISCRKRPVSQEQIEDLVWRVEKRSLETEGKEVSSASIGEFITSELKSVDPIAYIRFSSVYREYQNVEQFIEDVQSLRNF
ncbi:MAG: transcriptional repressor NrdR [Planctomycetes bacterium]|nr:transcriptional repressor NrdR [Planctomycetota bacterium]